MGIKVPHPLNTKEQYLYAINEKLDTLIELLTPAAPKKRVTKKEG